MKILIFDYDDVDNPYAGGGQAMQTKHISNILSNKHELTIITGNYPRAKNISLDNINFQRIGIGSFGSVVSILSYWITLPLVGFLISNKYDIVIECFTAPFAVSFLPLTVRKPLIALPTFFNTEKMSAKYKIIPFGIFEKLLINRYKYFAVFTKEIKNKIKGINKQAQVKIIPGGIDNTLIDKIPAKGDYILFLGRIDIFNKGLDILLESIYKIKNESGIKPNLVVAGNGKRKDVDEFLKIVKDLKLKNEVKYVGKVVGKKKINLINQCKFVVYPSSYETFGYTPLETLAAGKLLICFDIRGLRWIPSNLCLKVKRKNPDVLAKALKMSLNKVDLSDRKIRERKEFAKNFSWIDVVNKYERFIKYVLAFE